jgi:hypothetical protein
VAAFLQRAPRPQTAAVASVSPSAMGHGNNGHPSLAWASRDAAPCALRCSPTVQRLYQRKPAKRPLRVARKAVAHTLARACYDLRRALRPFEVHNAFGCGRATGGVAVGDGEEKWLKTIPFGACRPHPRSEGLPQAGGEGALSLLGGWGGA